MIMEKRGVVQNDVQFSYVKKFCFIDTEMYMYKEKKEKNKRTFIFWWYLNMHIDDTKVIIFWLE
jgi:hypothetical protein